MATLENEVKSGKAVDQIMSFINSIYNGHQPDDLIIINERLKMLIRQAGIVEIGDLDIFKNAKGYLSSKKEYLGNIYGDTIRIIFEGRNTRVTLVYQISKKRLIVDQSFAFAIDYI